MPAVYGLAGGLGFGVASIVVYLSSRFEALFASWWGAFTFIVVGPSTFIALQFYRTFLKWVNKLHLVKETARHLEVHKKDGRVPVTRLNAKQIVKCFEEYRGRGLATCSCWTSKCSRRC